MRFGRETSWLCHVSATRYWLAQRVLLQDAIGREAPRSHIGVVDDRCRMIGLYLYEGVFKVIPMPVGDHAGPHEAFNVRLVRTVLYKHSLAYISCFLVTGGGGC